MAGSPEGDAPQAPGAAADLVSVVVVAYNNWPDLELAIASARCQTYPHVEVIVVDNSSTDATPQEVPRRFGDAVRYVRQPNRGDAGAYNTGFALARGALIQFLDGDDFIAPTKIEKQVAVFRADPGADIVFGDVRQFRAHPGRPEWVDEDGREAQDMLAYFLDVDGKGGGMLAQACLFHRRALEGVGAWDETLYVADMDYWLRAAWEGCRFRHSPGALCFYRRRAGQMSADARAMARGVVAVWTKALTYIDREPYRTAAARYLARLRFGMAITETGLSSDEALKELRAARAICPGAIPEPLFQAGRLAVLTPGARSAARSRAFGFVRRAVARGLGLE